MFVYCCSYIITTPNIMCVSEESTRSISAGRDSANPFKARGVLCYITVR